MLHGSVDKTQRRMTCTELLKLARDDYLQISRALRRMDNSAPGDNRAFIERVAPECRFRVKRTLGLMRSMSAYNQDGHLKLHRVRLPSGGKRTRLFAFEMSVFEPGQRPSRLSPALRHLPFTP